MKRTLPHVAAAFAVAAIFLSGGLEFAERQLMDLRFRAFVRPVEPGIVVVAIDPESLGALSVWPWPRGYHATVVENLLASGAERIAFDLDFSSRSVEDEDAALAAALEQAAGRVLLPVFHQWQRDGRGGYRLVTTEPLSELASRSTLTSINIRPEPGGLVRRYWSRPVAGASTTSLAVALTGGETIGQDGFYIDFGLDPETIPRISYVDVLTGQFDPDLVRGASVIVGATALELGDQVSVPVHTTIPGPVLQALASTCLATGRALHRLPPAGVAVLVVLTGWIAGLSLERTRWRAGLAIVCVAAIALVGFSVGTQWLGPVIIDIAPFALALAASYAITLVRRIDQQNLRLLLQSVAVRRTTKRMRHVVEHSNDAILTLGQGGRIDSLNPAAERMLGISSAAAIGTPLSRFLSLPAHASPTTAEGFTHEAIARRASGETLPVEVTDTAFAVDGTPIRVMFIRDITRRKARQVELEHMATHDALTGLPNRLLLRRRVDRLLDDPGMDRVAFLILDLDRFKEVNDTLGHQVGDRLLRRIADRLREPLRPDDTIARLGGDEFAILLPSASLEEAREMAEALIATLTRPFELDTLRLQIEASIGIALYPDHGSEASALVRMADVAMYVAKRVRNTVAVYDSTEDFNSVRHLTLKGELRRAVDEDHLVLFYQPKVASRDGRIDGVEALLRWRHPEHGLVPPGDFIPLAEHTGLIKPITHWVLDAALRQAAEWSRQGIEMPISINCSARNLLEGDLPGIVRERLAAHGIPPSSLILEITETAIIEEPRRALSVLSSLAGLGVRISIDDFGTGFSSLEHLTRLPATELKIDKSFVLGLENETSHAVIVRSTIDLAHNLGLDAVAEGVDTEDVWRLLRSLGCDLSQGFLFSEPLDAAGLELWLRESRWGLRPAAARAGASRA